MEFTTRQREDLRWTYQIEGRESEKSWPTAGEAQRAAWDAVNKAKASSKETNWQWYLLYAVLAIPVLWLFLFLVRLVLGW
jgi:hypothetical protein